MTLPQLEVSLRQSQYPLIYGQHLALGILSSLSASSGDKRADFPCPRYYSQPRSSREAGERPRKTTGRTLKDAPSPASL